jgi:uroporphyrinogen decarboxylase
VPHFELVFFLTMESLGRVHPLHREFSQWKQMSYSEKKLHINDMADVYIQTAEKYDHSAIFVHPVSCAPEVLVEILKTIRDKSGDRYFLMVHGDPTYGVPDGDSMMDFSVSMVEDAPELHRVAEERLQSAISTAQSFAHFPNLLDGFALCSDYCFNTNPFYSPSAFDEFIAPYLSRAISAYREMGFFTIKHSDGNILPILESIVQCGPDAVHSLDPQGGVTIQSARAITQGRVALCGNVNCGLLHTGSEEDCIADIRNSLHEGMKKPGFIFCTSNCAYTGLPLKRYELMHQIWKKEGIYS